MNDDISGAIIGLIFGLFFGILFTYFVVSGIYETEAVEAGCAQYNSQTGDFEYKESN